MTKISIPSNLEALLINCKSPLYVVGGYIRDYLLGFEPTDIDLCGPLPANRLQLDPHYKVVPTSPKMGTAIITDGKSKFEYTPFRVETYAKGGYHSPEEVFFTTDITKDAARRDFCCNAIYYDLKNQQLIDIFDGVEDIKKGIIREIPYPARVFSSDGLRLLRLVRIAAETGLNIFEETLQNAKRFAYQLKDISGERIAEELRLILLADQKHGIEQAQYRGLKLIAELGLWDYCIRGISDMIGMPQNPLYHKYDVFEHTCKAVGFASPKIRLAALLHDIGKPIAMRKDGNTHMHASYGEQAVREILGIRGLRMSNAKIEETAWLVKNHMYNFDEKTSPFKLRIFCAQNFELLDKLILLKKADMAASGMVEYPERIQIEDVRDELVAQNAPLKIADLHINGQDCINEGLQGEQIKQALQFVFRETVLNIHLNTKEKQLALLQGYARKNKGNPC